ncbi:Golgi membrane protein 1 [Bombina bombina]|uniref:Golgi membrane protein 1 n=1 Tax=Bombina bombina TaxID=8345 RepID=UPI00235AF0F8|nr:Golgi membrane protein 1 [Bombina bombina]
MMGLGNGRRGMKSPPLVVAVLLACVFVLGINYWITSTRCVELQNRIVEIEGKMRRAAAERGAVELKKNQFEENLKKQMEQLDTIKSMHDSQKQTYYNEKVSLIRNITLKERVIKSLQGQLRNLQVELEQEKESQTLKSAFELAQCSNKMKELNEQCEEKLRKATQKENSGGEEKKIVTDALKHDNKIDIPSKPNVINKGPVVGTNKQEAADNAVPSIFKPSAGAPHKENLEDKNADDKNKIKETLDENEKMVLPGQNKVESENNLQVQEQVNQENSDNKLGNIANEELREEGGAKVELRPMAEEEAEEGAPKAEEGAPNAEEGAPKAEEGASEAEEGAPKAEEGAPKAEEGAPKAEEGAPKAEEGAPKAEEGAPKAKEAVPKAEEEEPNAEEEGPNAEEEPEDEFKVEDIPEPNKGIENEEVERENLINMEPQQEGENDINQDEQEEQENQNDYNGDEGNEAEPEADKQAQLINNDLNLKDDVNLENKQPFKQQVEDNNNSLLKK